MCVEKEGRSQDIGVKAFKDFKGFRTGDVARTFHKEVEMAEVDSTGNSRKNLRNGANNRAPRPSAEEEYQGRLEANDEQIWQNAQYEAENGYDYQQERSSKSVNKRVGDNERMARHRDLMGLKTSRDPGFKPGVKQDLSHKLCLSDRKQKNKLRGKRVLGRSLKSDKMEGYLMSMNKMRSKHLGPKVTRNSGGKGVYPKKRRFRRNEKLMKMNKSSDLTGKISRDSGSYAKQARDSLLKKETRVKTRNLKTRVVTNKKKVGRKRGDVVSVKKMRKYLKKPLKSTAKEGELELAGLSKIEETLRFYYRFKIFWKQTAVKNFLEQYLGVKLGYVRDIQPLNSTGL